MATAEWLRFCAVVVFSGILAHILGFVSPYWILEEDVRSGLWITCDEKGCLSFSSIAKYLNGWHHAVQALECLGLICACVSFVTSVIFIRNGGRSMAMFPGCLAIFAAISIGCGLLIYAVKELSASTVLGWAFFVECGAAAVLLPVGVLLLMIAGRSSKKSQASFDLSVRYVNGKPTSDL